MYSKNGKKRILIIEYDDSMSFLLKDFIGQEGCIIDSVDNGLKAIEKLARQPVDIIITDIQMPSLIELDVLPLLKKYQPDVSIIVISAFGGKKTFRRAFERGATAFMEKPIDLQKLKMLILDLISSKRSNSN